MGKYPPLLCRLCGAEFTLEMDDQLYCSEECQVADKKIDEQELRREAREESYDLIRTTFRGKKQ